MKINLVNVAPLSTLVAVCHVLLQGLWVSEAVSMLIPLFPPMRNRESKRWLGYWLSLSSLLSGKLSLRVMKQIKWDTIPHWFKDIHQSWTTSQTVLFGLTNYIDWGCFEQLKRQGKICEDGANCCVLLPAFSSHLTAWWLEAAPPWKVKRKWFSVVFAI